MKYENLKKLQELPYFTTQDLASILKIKPESAWVLCSRYIAKGVFVRLKNNFYVLDQNWDKLSTLEMLKISNYVQVPSYISFMTALSFYEVTTQVQRSFFESVSLKRSIKYEVKEVVFDYRKIKREYYFGFEKIRGIFVAAKEKALIDAIYLSSYGKYRFDIDAIDFKKFSRKKLLEMCKPFPVKTKEMMENICRI